MGDTGLLLKGAGDIVEEGSRDEDRHIRTLADADTPAEAGDPCGVIESVGAGCLEKRPDMVLDLIHSLMHE